jgi:hypothetical protein
MEVTQRGFAIYGELTDRPGHKIEVIESSLAEEHAVRIYWHNPKYMRTGTMTGEPVPPCLHLNEDQARQLRAALDLFLEEPNEVARLRLWHERIIEYWNCAEYELGYQPNWRLIALAMKQHSEEALGQPYSIVLDDGTGEGE